VVARHRLTEVERGLFLAENGEALDMRGQPPTWHKLRARSRRQRPLALAMGGSRFGGPRVGLVADGRSGHDDPTAPRICRGKSLEASQVAPALRRRCDARRNVHARDHRGACGNAGTRRSGFLGWLELPIAQRLMLHLPLALTVAAGSLVVLTAFGLIGRWWRRAAALRYVGLAAVSVAVAAQLAAWQLIGWGLT